MSATDLVRQGDAADQDYVAESSSNTPVGQVFAVLSN
jgi:hypothetical protein